MLKSAMLFYLKLVDNLKKIGCEINPYDPCVMNKNVGGSQLTITWHVDDLKVSHKDPSEVTKITEYLDVNKTKIGVKSSFAHGLSS